MIALSDPIVIPKVYGRQEGIRPFEAKGVLSIACGAPLFLLATVPFSLAFTGLAESYLLVLPLCLVIFLMLHMSGAAELLGEDLTASSVVFCLLVTTFSIFFYSEVVYADYIRGISNSISQHYEHNLMFAEMETITTRLYEGKSLEQAVYGLPLNQYYYIFVYTTLLFYFGGINVTNMCLWGMLHVFVTAISICLTADKCGMSKKGIRLAYGLALVEPLFLSIGIYNKVIVGEAFIMFAVYMMTCASDKPLAMLMVFPACAFLFWAVRLQYLLIAIVFAIVLLVTRNDYRGHEFIISVLALISIGLFLVTRPGIVEYVMVDLNVDDYTLGYNYNILALGVRLVRSLINYFPWTNLTSDMYWYYSIFGVLQSALNITLWITLLRKCKTPSVLWRNPHVFLAGLFFLAGMLSSLHITYVSVGVPLMSLGFKGNEASSLKKTVLLIVLFLLVSSLVYYALGLKGSGTMSIEVA